MAKRSKNTKRTRPAEPIIDEDLARAGGVTAFDRIDDQPWLDSKERFSFVSSDPLAIASATSPRREALDERLHPTQD